MTADEMRRQKVELRLDLEEAEKRLAHLRESATRRADKIMEFAQRLKARPETDIYREGHSIHHGQPVEQLRFLSDSDIEALQLTPALELANSIRRELAKVNDLKQRLARLG